ncbi:MAG: hypothetical protein K2M93_06735 [Muribaculaceae bacterium]|nr:hypothetical protein [Muribaculaceae bacterium]
MKTKKISIIVAALFVTATSLCSCKGRTMKNMEPTGDTVEVEITPLVPDVDEDSVADISGSEAAL